MNHYTYKLEFENDMKYIGVRSCKCPIEDDKYLGSSKIIPEYLYKTCVKTVIQTFSTRAEAIQHEADLHKKFDVALNTKFYNQVCQTSTKFDMQGCTKETHAHVKAISDKLSGRTAKTHEYLNTIASKNRTHRNSNRTAKQKQADLQVSKFQTGKPNKLKGNKGTEHIKYRPWYYITPDGELVEVYKTITDYCKDENFFNYEAVRHAVKDVSHQPIARGKMKGYVCGDLHNKPDYLTQDNILLYYQLMQHLPYYNVQKIQGMSDKKLESSLKNLNQINKTGVD